MLKSAAIAMASVLFLSGCATQLGAGVGVAVKEGRATEDVVTKGLLAAVCAASVGSYFRLDNPRDQAGLRLLCGPAQISLPNTTQDANR